MHIELYNADLLNFVEFNLTGDNDNFNRCDVESKYLDSPVFYLFQPCFEEANKVYDYFAGTKYNSRKIIVLLNELKACLKTFESLQHAADFTNLISSRFMGKEFLAELEDVDSQWITYWKEYNRKIIGVNKDLIELVEKCAFEEKVLWVIGY
ncbi:MAG TPA: hypothetical protein VHI78_10300 [Bacteroidales bacterium]|jgi:hypothetical protein|nr:hypothetical protein [Bacteroidales bacterium]